MPSNFDFINTNWWTAAVSGTTYSGSAGQDIYPQPDLGGTWAEDYTRHRSRTPVPDSATYSGITDFNSHSGDNMPTDLWYGRKESIQDVNP